MKIKVGTVSLAFAAILGSLFAGSAHAAGTTSIETRLVDGVAWAEAAISERAERLQIRILAPGRDGSRRLWQTCRFEDVAGGTYSCGIDASPGSRAARLRGTWVASVVVDGEPVARTSFHL